LRSARDRAKASCDTGSDSSPEAPIAAFRFIHTADIHLDSPLKSLALRDPALAELVRDATRQAFTRIVDMAIEEQVDALLIAGDLYDGEQTSMKTARFIAAAYKRLTDAGVRVFVIRGNHDSMSKIMRELTLPAGVTVFGGKPGVETIERIGARPIAIHGLSFKEPDAPESLLPKYRPPAAEAVNIGLMHTSLGGSPGHDPYAPVSLADLQASGFRYWALGHIHKRSVHVGETTVVMPGMPQGRDIGEAGRKSVTLVTVADDGAISLEERVTSGAVFAPVDVDLAGEADWAKLARRISSAAGAAAERGGETILRIGLSGSTPLAWRIRRDLDALQAEVELVLGQGSGLWIERFSCACKLDGGAEDGGALGELERLIETEVLPSDSFRHGADEQADALLRQLPPDVRDRWFGRTEEEQARALARLAAEGAAEILARLRTDGNAA
jgi:DNA repair protein SbcD/Mre11